ncbi:hypothetical protein EK21DRAFT_109298 [Setomelanomma holmii]|uniref:Uncharacterized protein n=1 Tax=Setomelanomma holmii TaxID=210430 RepID=A0A9P4LRV4_9PLEO|nr:hypothetical protein EK21DRAFT_109298 [Setomelanomma holmii]
MSQREQSPRPMGFVSAMSDTNVKDDETHEQNEKHKGHNPWPNVTHYLKKAMTLEPEKDEETREGVISEREHRNDHGGKDAEARFWELHRRRDSKRKSANPDNKARANSDGGPCDTAVADTEPRKEDKDKKSEHHFWERRRSGEAKQKCQQEHEHGSECEQPDTNLTAEPVQSKEKIDKKTMHHFWNLHHRTHHGREICNEAHEHTPEYEEARNRTVIEPEHYTEHAAKKDAEVHHFWNLHHRYLQRNGKEPEHLDHGGHGGATGNAIGHVMARKDEQQKSVGPAVGMMM